MKLNKLFISAVAVASMGLASCVGDLDLQPTNPNDLTPNKFAEDPEGYMQQTIGMLYLDFASYGYGTDSNGSNILGSMDGGMSTFQRAIFNMQEIPSDEANWLPSADAIPPTFQYGLIPANDGVVMGVYSRLMVNVALANNFIQTDFGCTTDAQKTMREEFVRQAKILRGASYYYLIDLYGNVPWADENVTIGSIPPQLSANFEEGRRMVFDEATRELEEVVAWYKQNQPNQKAKYGYVGLDVAEALLVKYYLNAEVYTGTPRWKDCCEHAQALIDRLGKGGFQNSGLCNSYFQNFGYNNKQFVIGGSSDINEIIWGITVDNPALNDANMGVKQYANGGFMCNAWIGDAPADADFHCTQAEYNSGNGWKCMSARRQFVEVFDWDANFAYSPDVRTALWKTAADGFNINNDVFDQANWGKNGYLAVKYSNWNWDDNGQKLADQPAAVDPLGIDYAMIRLAEVYLSYAEAALQGGGDKALALKYVNYVRERAQMPAYDNINLPELQRERQRELYTECTRRTDLVRYGKWVSGYTWNWKNNAKYGTDFPAYFTVYPLPSTVVTRNGYVQNPGF